MKILRILFSLLGLATLTLRGASVSGSSYDAETISVTGGAYDLTFAVTWTCDDYHVTSAPGRVELWQGGSRLGSVSASVYRNTGPAASASPGSVSDVSGWIGIYNGDGTPADGGMTATWHMSGLADGSYTLRYYRYTTYITLYNATTVWTDTYHVAGGSPLPPSTPPTPPDPEPPTPPPPPAQYSLATSAGGGGSVTPGGSYTAGSVVTVTAMPDSAHYFGGWSGDAAGIAPVATVTIDRDRSVYATFIPKGTQAITFAPLSNLPVGAPPQILTASSSSGLPVTFSVSAGPATLSGNVLTVTGPGVVTITAMQNGDGIFLPAAPVTRTFTTNAPGVIRFQNPTRTLLENASPNAHYVLPTLP